MTGPATGRRRRSGELRDHVAERLDRAPRYRQRLAWVPLGVHDPVWVDDEAFDIDHHVLRAGAPDLQGIVDLAMSSQLERSRPLWERWIADRLRDGRIGVVGKAHHCMVDGLAAVELASLMLDAEPEPELAAAPPWQPEPAPGQASLLARGLIERVRDELDVLRVPGGLLASPRRRLGELAGEGRRAARALGHALGTPAPMSRFNQPSSALRHLATIARPLDDLRRIKSRYDVTINDVVLAVCAGGARRFLQQHDEPAIRLKAMVPASVREAGATSELGNRISFIFIELPCDEHDPVRRLRAINRVTSERKRSGEPAGQTPCSRPPRTRRTSSSTPSRGWSRVRVRSTSSSRTSRAHSSRSTCAVVEVYPIVPLAERHAVSIGVTTIAGRVSFGLYADRKTLPNVDLLASYVDDAIEELLTRDRPVGHRRRSRAHGAPNAHA